MVRKTFTSQRIGLVIAGALCGGSFAQEKPAGNMEMLRAKIRAGKKLMVAVNMELTESEANVF
jgi:hypothetical protein